MNSNIFSGGSNAIRLKLAVALRCALLVVFGINLFGALSRVPVNQTTRVAMATAILTVTHLSLVAVAFMHEANEAHHT